MFLDIKKEGDPVLRQPTEKVTDFGFEFQKFVDDMVATMRKTGMGLAAPQVGVSKKLFVAELTVEKGSEFEGFPLTILANPEIIESSKSQVSMVEGCLSIPGREIIVKRPKRVTVKGQDRYGNEVIIQADKLQARAMQHEIDHLNCTLMVDHIQTTKTMFIGTGPFGVKALERLIADTQYDIVGVVTGDTRATIRGKKVERNEIYEIAKKAKIPILRTENIKDENSIEKIKKWHPQLGVMADFGQIIPESVINIPKYGIINLHPSLLPRHRGPSPIQQTILDGDKSAGITLMLTVKEMDAGPIIAQGVVELSGSETSSILEEYLSDFAATLLLESLPYYLTGEIKPIKQVEENATYTTLFKKDDGFVDTNTPATVVERKIRAFDQWPKVYTLIGGKRIQLLASHFGEGGELVLDRVKPEGKKEMSYVDFKNGYRSPLTFTQ